MKVMTVLGTRPEIIKLSCLIPLLDEYTEHVLVHTGQNSSDCLSRIQFDQLGLRTPDHWLGIETTRGPAQAIADAISKVDLLLETIRPDAFVIYGDTNSCMSMIAAKRRKIPVFHFEAGNRCFDESTPEELNRRAIDHLSDVNLCLTEHARRNLIAEGRPADRTFVVGSPMPEIFNDRLKKLAARPLPLDLRPRKYLLISVHREENVDSVYNLSRLSRTLGALAQMYLDDRLILSLHPRTKDRLGACAGGWPHRIELCEPFGWLDWVRLQQDARCVLSDSGSLTEEACILGFPAVMLREQHERPEGQDAGSAIMAGLNPDRVLEAVRIACEVPHGEFAAACYGYHQFSTAALRIILGYTDYVNRTVWSKQEKV